MAFPEIQHCLICEDVRLERGGLGTLIGFYGIAPDVEILVRNLNAPIERLCFLLTAKAGGTGKHTISAQILGEDEKEIAAFKGLHWKANEQKPNARHSFALAVGAPRFTKPGTYTFRLFADDTLTFETTFVVRQGEEADFK
ncbi:MAG: hypothetical protein H8J66_06045 [Nitrospira sp.]|nr:hypothetical protein [Nitrospira sp.]